MAREYTDPQKIPDDADGRDLAAYVGEDIGRVLMLRVAVGVAIITVVAGLMSESATDSLATACTAAGGAGVGLLLVAQLFGWRRSRQWLVIVSVTLVCCALLAAVFIGSRP